MSPPVPEIVFWFCIVIALHTYLLFPLIIGIIGALYKKKTILPDGPPLFPPISIIISAFNEEDSIVRCVENIEVQDYPKECLELIIGSDGSTDRTNQLLTDLAAHRPWLRSELFEKNRGKANVINDLARMARYDVLVCTDADITFDAGALREVVQPFQDEGVGAVAGTRLVDVEHSRSTIVKEESSYLNFDNRIREAEGRCGCVIGAHGSLFAIRRSVFRPLPADSFYTDDFYYSMLPFEAGLKVVAAPHAISRSATAENASSDFRRRVRYSSTAFASVWRFRSLLLDRRIVLSYCFWSHRVCRWFFPLFMLLLFVLNMILLGQHLIYSVMLVGQLGLYGSAFLGWMLSANGHRSGPLRFSYYFVMSNAALLFGFFRFLSGRNSNTWKPLR